jgi:hypothetical protein
MRLMWCPGKVSARSLESYLHFVRNLFSMSRRSFCEERALFFLKECGYDVALAQTLLATPESDEPPATANGEDVAAEGEDGMADTAAAAAAAGGGSSSSSRKSGGGVGRDRDDSSDSESGSSSEAEAPAVLEIDDFCMVCRDGGNLMLCDYEKCRKAFHPHCVHLDKVPDGDWHCPYHQCVVCGDESNDQHNWCTQCPTAYCDEHIPTDSQTRADAMDLVEFLCANCMDGAEEEEKGRQTGRIRFLKRVFFLLKKAGRPLFRLPAINGRSLNLYSLYKIVTAYGGIHKVVSKSLWAKVRRALKWEDSASAKAQLKKYYLALVYPYEKK